MIDKLAILKARQTRGAGWVQIITNIGIITANIGIFYEMFPICDLKYLLLFGAMGYIVLTVLIGIIDEKYGIWKSENAYNSGFLNPVISEIHIKTRRIYEKLMEES